MIRPLTRSLSPFSLMTIRGFALLLFSLFLLFQPLIAEHDIVAGTIGISILALIALCVFTTAICAYVMKKRTTYDMSFSGAETDELLSGQPMAVVIRTSPLRVLPFSVVDLKPLFQRSGVICPLLRISGAKKAERVIAADVMFQHRGEWKVEGLLVSLRDRFGISSSQWKIAQPTNCRVSVPIARDVSIPPRSSAERAGDVTESFLNRQGEPFDVKRYHPSDGVKKILWKVFARTGELLSRHPEPSMSPDGHLVAYIMAGTFEDVVASRALGYLEIVAQSDIGLYVGCEGMGGRLAAQSVEEAEKLLIDSAWEASQTSTTSRANEALGLIKNHEQLFAGASVRRLVFVVGTKRSSNASTCKELLELADGIAACGVEPVFAVAEEFSPHHQEDYKPSGKIASWFFDIPSKKVGEFDAGAHPLLQACMNRRWEVLMENEQGV